MNSDLIFYRTPEGDRKIEVVFQNEDFWLTQKVLADLFAVGVPAVSKHLKNIFESGEYLEDSVVSILETTAADGKDYFAELIDPAIKTADRPLTETNV